MTRHHGIVYAAAALLLTTSCTAGAPTSPSSPPVAAASGSLNANSGVEHSVTGSGIVSQDGIDFRVSIAAHSDAAGNVWGETAVLLDLRAAGLGKGTFVGKVYCLEVDGNSAWIGASITHSNIGAVVPAGTNAIALVRDLGGNGEDIMNGESFDSSVKCTDRPALEETIVERGNFTVR